MLTTLGIALIIFGVIVTTLSAIFEVKYKKVELIIGVIIGMVAIQIGVQLYTSGEITGAIKDSRDRIVGAIKDSRDETISAIKDSRDETISAIKDSRDLILDRLP